MPLLNDFLVGADPEFVIVNGGHLQLFGGQHGTYDPWGLDHGGWVIEPHPKPEKSVRQLVRNLKVAFNDFATVAPSGTWRAGGYFVAPERTITLGGHVHVDKPTCTEAQLAALDLYARHLEALDILPSTECNSRRHERAGYGRYGDVRVEHGHFEYRTLPSWLYSQGVAKLCLTGTKLIMVDPEAPGETLGKTTNYTSKEKLKAFFERFRGKDNDADWLLATTLNRKYNVKPDRDLRDVWKVKPEKEKPHWKEVQHQDIQPAFTLAQRAEQVRQARLAREQRARDAEIIADRLADDDD